VPYNQIINKANLLTYPYNPSMNIDKTTNVIMMSYKTGTIPITHGLNHEKVSSIIHDYLKAISTPSYSMKVSYFVWPSYICFTRSA
jgi:hypothetical protein